MRSFLIGLGLVLFAVSASAQTAAQSQAVEHAVRIGQQLYDHDRAAWLATDAMLADISDPRGEGIRGWITKPAEDGVVVLFVRPDGENPVAVYRALYRNEALVERRRVNQRLTADDIKLYRAREIASHTPYAACAENYNTVVLPRVEPNADGVDVDVYLMPAQTQTDLFPFGGYYRMGVNSSAGAVRETQQFTNGCLSINAAMPPGTTERMLWVTQVVTDTPTEVHVFVSLSSRLPVYVSSRSGLWEITGARARTVPSDRPL